MKTVAPLLTLCFLILTAPLTQAIGDAVELGYSPNTILLDQGGDREICPGTTLLTNDDGTYENGYSWGGDGIVAPYYGAWAEGYDGAYVCGVEFIFSQVGAFFGQSMDVYVWDADAQNPGNVLCAIMGVVPEAPAFWPELSIHPVQTCCTTNGFHFVGWWGNWPGAINGWFIIADETGPGLGAPRTNIAPGLGYPDGWQHVSIAFPYCKDLGIHEYSGLGDCLPTPSATSTWGQIKSFY